MSPLRDTIVARARAGDVEAIEYLVRSLPRTLSKGVVRRCLTAVEGFLGVNGIEMQSIAAMLPDNLDAIAERLEARRDAKRR